MTVAKKPRSCQQQLPAWPIPLRSWAPGPSPTPLPRLFPGRDGCSRGRRAGASWLVAMNLQGLKVTQECAWPGLQLGSGFLCDLEQVTSSLASAFFCVQGVLYV